MGSKTVVGVFESRGQAEKAVGELRDGGFRDNEINIVARDDRGNEGARGGGFQAGGRGTDVGNFTNQNVTDGVTWGGTVGGLAGLLAGAGALAIPGIGPIVAAGPIAGALSGAVTGGVTGGLLDFGIPEARGRHFEERVRQGGILALVRTSEEKANDAAHIFRHNGASDVEIHDAEGRGTGRYGGDRGPAREGER